jgi:hypothetical protein
MTRGLQSPQAFNRQGPNGLGPSRASSSSDPDGHIDDLTAQVGNVLVDVFGTELVWRTVEILPNYTPMLSEHGCERLSHDQPIRLFPTVNYWLTSRSTSWQNAKQCAQRSAVADSLAQVAARFRKSAAQQGARRGQRNRTQTGMI